MNSVFKRLAAFLMCVALVIGVPSAAFAEEWGDGANELLSLETGVGSSAEVTYDDETGELQASTNVDILIYSGVEIIDQTEDCIISAGDDVQLGIAVRGISPFTYVWEVSYDQGDTWQTIEDAASAPTYDIVDAQYLPNDPDFVKPYCYRVTVYDTAGHSDSTVIEVLVSPGDDYSYRRIEDVATEIATSALMHKDTLLDVDLLDENSTAYEELEQHLAPGCLPLIAADVALYNSGETDAVPYLGKIELEFNVGTEYDGQTLKVYQLLNGQIVEYSAAVEDGVLTITVDELSQFMVEAPKKEAHTITVTTSQGGSTSPSGIITVEDGDDKTITILPDEGYEIAQVLVDGEPVEITGNSYTFTDITEDHTFDVTFEKIEAADPITHTVTVNAGKNGTVSPSGTFEVADGDSLVVSIFPDSGYEVDKVLVNGVEYEIAGNYLTISSVTEDLEIEITFKESDSDGDDVVVTRTITASAGEGGIISPSGKNTVNYGGDMYFYIIPDEGYEIDTVLVDGNEVEITGNSYHFINVVSDHTIKVTFREGEDGGIDNGDVFVITAKGGSHGTISPSGDVYVAKGGSQTFHFTPDNGYIVSKIIVNGKVVAITGRSYTVTNVQSDMTISVEFVKAGDIQTGEDPDPSYLWCWILLCAAGGVAVLMIILIVVRRKKEEEDEEADGTYDPGFRQ